MSSVLKVSEAASLALHSAAYLAEHPDPPVPTREITAVLQVSEAHLAKVLQRLAKVGLVRSIRGPHGGFALARSAGDVTLLDIYEAIEGPLGTTHCLFGRPVCSGDRCLLGGLLRRIDGQVRRHLTETTLADMVPVFRSEHAHA